MQYSDGVIEDLQLKSDYAFTDDYGGIACLRQNEYLLASKHSPSFFLVRETHIVSSFFMSLPDAYTDSICCGLAATEDCRRVYALYCTARGILVVIWVDIDGDEITHTPDAIMPMPQGLSDVVISENEVFWDNDGVLAELLMDSPINDGDAFYTYKAEYPVGPAVQGLKPCIALEGTKLIVAVNHIQIVSLTQHHTLVFVPKEIFQEWASAVTSVDYAENLWWRHNVVKKWVQRTEECTGDLHCDMCGRITSCKGVALLEGIEPPQMPVWDEEGNPLIEERDVDIINATTTMQTAVLLSSVIMMDTHTGLLQGITHFGSSGFGHVKAADNTAKVILAMDCYNGYVDIVAGLSQKIVYVDPLMWGSEPMSQDSVESVKYSFKAFLEWWDKNHVANPTLKDPFTWFGTEDIRPSLLAHVAIDDLKVSPEITRSQTFADIGYSRPGFPYTGISGLYDMSESYMGDTGYLIYGQHIMRYSRVTYEIESYFEDDVLDVRPDIVVGRVLQGVPKTVKCVFRSLDERFRMTEFTISVYPDPNYPYYIYCQLSKDNVAWSYDLQFPALDPMTEVTFYCRILTSSTIPDPKPIKVQVKYRRGL